MENSKLTMNSVLFRVNNDLHYWIVGPYRFKLGYFEFPVTLNSKRYCPWVCLSAIYCCLFRTPVACQRAHVGAHALAELLIFQTIVPFLRESKLRSPSLITLINSKLTIIN